MTDNGYLNCEMKTNTGLFNKLTLTWVEWYLYVKSAQDNETQRINATLNNSIALKHN